MNVLSLHDAVHVHELRDGKVVRQRQSHYLDLHVDGHPLRDWFDDTHELVTALHRPWLGTLDAAIAELTGRRPDPDLPGGRIALLRCAECGDLGCGALTARLTITPQTVTWSDFAWENGDDEAAPQQPGPAFVFDHDAYLDALHTSGARVAALPHVPLPH